MQLNSHLHSGGVGAMGHKYFQGLYCFFVCCMALWTLANGNHNHYLTSSAALYFGCYSSGTPVCYCQWVTVKWASVSEERLWDVLFPQYVTVVFVFAGFQSFGQDFDSCCYIYKLLNAEMLLASYNSRREENTVT